MPLPFRTQFCLEKVFSYEKETTKRLRRSYIDACYFNGPFLYTENPYFVQFKSYKCRKKLLEELIISQLYESFQNKFSAKCLLGGGDNRVLKH
jgi:hypothetical protein